MSNSFAENAYALFDNPANGKIIREIEKTGAKVFVFPVAEAIKTETTEKSVETIANLKRYDWVIFPDVWTVDFFLEILEENQTDFYALDDLRVCALGEVVADRLRFAQLHADVIPNRIDAETAVSAIKSYAAGELKDLKFLYVKEISLDNEIEAELKKARATISTLPIYRLTIAAKDEIARLKTLLAGGAIDEFVFSAPTDFIALKYICREKPLAEIFSGIAISAVDGQTLQNARENGIKRADLFRLEKIDTV